MKIIVVGALPESLMNFRGDLIKTLVRNGHDVIAMAAPTSNEIKGQIEALGCRFISFPVARNGLNPFHDLNTLLALYRCFKQQKPDLVLSYTIKPVIFGGIAARLCGSIRFFGLITGLGFVFQQGGLTRKLLAFIARNLYRLALSPSEKVIFQNQDNLNVFVEQAIVDRNQTARVYGSGVNLQHFEAVDFPQGPPTFLTIARLLGEKGLREYAQAAEIVKARYPQARFHLLGPEDPSPNGIPLAEVQSWTAVEYLGESSDVRPFIAACHIFVLASYHEGMPRTVLEAMSMARPILTTNVPGCKETVVNGENGWLVEKQNVEQLAEQMIWFIDHPECWQLMADKARKMALAQFDVHKVNDALMQIMNLENQAKL